MIFSNSINQQKTNLYEKYERPAIYFLYFSYRFARPYPTVRSGGLFDDSIMQKLNLPEYDFRIQKREKGLQIFDPLRKKFIALTPEEWVRQNFIQYLVQEKKYPVSLMAVESGLKYHGLRKRSDIRVFDKAGNVWMIVECKKPDVKISQETFDQVATYNMAHKTRTRYLAVTNGLDHYCCETRAHTDYEHSAYLFLRDFPEYK